MDLPASNTPQPEEDLPAGSPQSEEPEEEQAGRRRECDADSDSDSSSLGERVEVVKDGVVLDQRQIDDNYDADPDYSENIDEEDYEECYGTFNGYPDSEDSTSENEDDYYNNPVETEEGITVLELVDDENEKLGFKPVMDLSEKGCEKEMRAHILGALMADGLQMREGLTVADMNQYLEIATVGHQLGFFARSLLSYTPDDQEFVDTKSLNEFLMMPKFKDVIKYDLQKNRFTPVLEPNSTLEKLAEEIYRTAYKKKERDDVLEKKKTDTMDIPANRLRYMGASNMLVSILVEISNRESFNLGEKISWDKVRDYYEKDIYTDKNHIYGQFNDLLGLDAAGAKLNSKSVKAIFGRSSVKEFLKHPIYSKIKSCHGNQMMLSLDAVQFKNKESYYTEKDFAEVQAVIDAKTLTEPHFEHIDRKQRAEKEKEERIKNFVGIPEQPVFVPKVEKREVPRNLFGGPKMQQSEEQPKRVKEDYVDAEEEEKQQKEDEEDASGAESDEASSDYGDKPKERKQFFTDSEDSDDEKEDDVQQRIRNEKKRGKPHVKKQAPQMTGLFSSAMKSNVKTVTETQGGWETPIVNTPLVDQNTAVNAPEEPDAPLRLELVEVESDAAKKGKEIYPPHHTSNEQRARMEEFAKQSSVEVEKPSVPAEQIYPSASSPIPDNESEDDECPFKVAFVKAEGEIYKRPQMPNEKHHLHVKQKEKEHEVKIKEKEQEKLKKQQEEKNRKMAELARQEKEKQERMAAEERRPPPQQRPTFGTGFGPQKASFGKSVFNVPAPEKAAPAPSAPSPAPGKGLFTARAHNSGQNPMQQRPESRSFNPGSAFTHPASSPSQQNYSQPQKGQQEWNQAEQRQWPGPPPNPQNYGQGPSYPQHSPSSQQNYDQRQSYQQPAPPKSQNYDQGPSYHQNGPPNTQNYGHGAPYQQQPNAQSSRNGDDFERQWSQPNQQKFQQGYQSPPRMQQNQYGNPQYNNDSNFGPDMNPPEPRLGSTTYQPTFGTASFGCQTEPIDVLLEELMGNSSINGIQDPSKMSNEDLFLHYVITHVYVHRDEEHCGRRLWKAMKMTLPEPLSQPEMLFGRDWMDEVQRLLQGKVCITLTKTKTILFEWNGD